MMRSCKREKPASGKMTISAAVHIPEEIVVKILSGLPVKSLLRFSCVCKSWWVTINKNPWFISQHLSRSTLNANGGNLLICSQPLRGKNILHLDMLLDVNRGISFKFKDHICTPLTIPSSFKDISLADICSINGLIIFHKRFSSQGYTVWNPATGRFKNIRLERKLNDGQLVRRFVGFGVAPGDFNYKLVSIQIYKKNRKEKGSDIVLIQVCSSLSGLWREIDAATTFPADYNIRIREENFFRFWRSELGILAKGVLYWILDQKIIVGFNIRDEVFYQLTMPDFHGIGVDVECFKLAEIKGSLALIPSSTLHGLYYVWEMNERAEAWTKRHSGPPVFEYLWMVGHWKSYSFVVNDIPTGNLIIQMPKACPSVGAETQEISSFPGEERWIIGAYNYVESLVPVE